MKLLRIIEKSIEKPFMAMPAIPLDTKRGLTVIWPWLALIGGILQLLLAISLFNWARYLTSVVDYTSTISLALGGDAVSKSRLTVWVWIALGLLVIDAAILLLAFPKLLKRQKGGWQLLLLAVLINLAYSVFSLFIDGRGGVSSLIMSLIITMAILYLLFQIRDQYSQKITRSHVGKTNGK